MSDRDALYAAILAHPDDDTPRLVYADWLQEHGDELQAEFIRGQIAEDREPWGEAGLRAHYTGGEQRERYNKFVAALEYDGGSWELAHARGFPSMIREQPWLDANDPKWLDRLPDLLRQVPIDALEFNREHEGVRPWAELVTHPLFRHIRILKHILIDRSVADVRALTSSPHACNVRELDIKFDTERALIAFFKSRFAKQLTRLSFSCFHQSEGAARAIAAMLPKSKLRRLRMYGSGELWDAICTSFPPGLESLRFSGAIGKRGLGPFARSLSNPTLRSLELCCSLSVEDAQALAGSEGLSGLNELRLTQCKINPAFMQSLAKSPHLSNLRSLWIDETPLGDSAARAIASSPYLQNLLVLYARDCDFTDVAAEAFLNAPFGANMLYLDILRYRGRISPVMKRKLSRRYKNRVNV